MKWSFWKIIRVVYPFVLLAFLYIVWRDVLPIYKVLTKPIENTGTVSAPTTRSILDAAPSSLPAFKEVVEKTAPRSSQAHTGLGLLHESKGMTEEAIGYYRKAIELEPGMPEASFRLGYILSGRGERPEARRLYEGALNARPGYKPALYGLAAALQEDGEPHRAEELYRQILAIDSKEYQALNNLGILFENEGLSARALDCYLLAEKINPKDPVVADNAKHAREIYGDLKPAACIEAGLPEPVLDQKPSPSEIVKKVGAWPKDPVSSWAPKNIIRSKNGNEIYATIVRRDANGLWLEVGDGAQVYMLHSEITSVAEA